MIYNTLQKALLFVFVLFSTFQVFSQIECYQVNVLQGAEVFLDEYGHAYITGAMVLDNEEFCSDIGIVTAFALNGDTLYNEVTCEQLDQTLDVHVRNPISNNEGWGTIIVRDGGGPLFDCRDTTLYCFDDYLPDGMGYPYVEDMCNEVASVTYLDSTEYFDCGFFDFTGHFDIHNWCIACGCNVSGWVDTIYVPDSIILHGSVNIDLPTDQYLTSLKRQVPAAGVIHFDWRTEGGSSSIDSFYFQVNDSIIVLSLGGDAEGSFSSWELEENDIISFNINSDGDEDIISATISGFEFISSISKIITRKWFASDNLGNNSECSQTIYVYRVTPSDIIFPDDYTELNNNALECGDDYSPENTGYPMIDRDGDPNTDDLVSIFDNSCVQVSYEDLEFDLCGNGKFISRTWSIAVECTDNIQTHIQTIKLMDTTPPVIECSSDTVNVDANQLNCNTSINMMEYLPEMYDECGGQITYSVQWEFGYGVAVYQNIPTGVYPVIFSAMDECGNISTCTIILKISDTTSPIAICQEYVTASIIENGQIEVFAESFDQSSYDNCCLDYIVVRREGDTDWENSVVFDCSDIGQMQFVEMKVVDCVGNFNICTISVEVQDKIAPTVYCPEDVIIDCSVNPNENLSQYGEATATDNCDYTISYSTWSDISNCGTGTIWRQWIATDSQELADTCIQTISVENLTPWNANGDMIIWPLDYTIASCGAYPLPENMPEGYAEPITEGGFSCEIIASNYSDEVFSAGSDACLQIIRTWTIMDWCQNQSWTHVQNIWVNDDIDPVFITNGDPLVVEFFNDDCSGTVTLPIPIVEDCNPNVDITASSDFGEGFGPFYNVAAGTYTVTYTANDGCGNNSQQQILVQVVDGKNPTPYCMGNLVLELGTSDDGPQAILTTDMVDIGSYDNCTTSENLIYSFSGDEIIDELIFNCTQVGLNYIQLWVTDEAGNSDYCTVTLDVQDNLNICNDNVTFFIAGEILTEQNQPIGQVELIAEGDNFHTENTSDNGLYTFSSLPAYQNYSITPSKDINYRNGVTVLDLDLMSGFLSGGTEISSPYTLVGMDVSNDGVIDSTDWNMILDLVLMNTEEYPNSESWRFIPSLFDFVDPTNPFSTFIPDHALVFNLSNNLDNVDFIGIKMGDINLDNNPEEVTAGNPRSGDIIMMYTEDRLLEEGQTIEVSVNLQEQTDIRSMQMTVDFDPSALELISIISRKSDKEGRDIFGMTHLGEGKLTLAQIVDSNIDEVIKLRMHVKRKSFLKDVFDINSSMTEALLYRQANDETETTIKFVFRDGEGNILQPKSALGYSKIYPNPFSRFSTIEFDMNTTQQGQIEVYSLAGKKVVNKSITGYKGINFFKLDEVFSDQLDGTYMYRLIFPDNVFSGKFTYLK